MSGIICDTLGELRAATAHLTDECPISPLSIVYQLTIKSGGSLLIRPVEADDDGGSDTYGGDLG